MFIKSELAPTAQGGVGVSDALGLDTRHANECGHQWVPIARSTRGPSPGSGTCPGLVSKRLVLPADLEAEDPSRVVDNQGTDIGLRQTALTQAGYDVGEQMVIPETAVGVKPMLGGDVV